jgi:hypothetical protein
MHRRQLLAALGALVSAGCLGAKRPAPASSGVRTEGSAPPQTRTPYATARPTATPTPEPEPTATPEPEPSDESVEVAAAAIDRVQADLAAAVEAYAGGRDDLHSVPLSGSFDVRPVFLALDTVQRSLAAAEAAAVTDDHRATVADLRVAERFLTQSTLAQSYFAETADVLDVARFSTGIDEAEALESRFDSVLRRGSDAVTTLKNDVDGSAVPTADALDDDSYDAVVASFETVRAVLDDASSGLDRLLQGLDELADAHEADADGDDADVADAAEEARTYFEEAYDFFDDAAATASTADLDPLPSSLTAFQEFADEHYVEADILYDSVT